MKIIITGGAGFIGPAIVRDLLNDTNNLTLRLDNRTYAGNLGSLAQMVNSESFKFEHADICERQGLERIFIGFQYDTIMHLATESLVDRSNDVPAIFIESNNVGNNTLPEAARQSWQNRNDTAEKALRFNLISTDEVYGELHAIDEQFTVTMHAPSRLYSASKSSAVLG
jgi:dTDP-glucose 4,6-dehydratase